MTALNVLITRPQEQSQVLAAVLADKGFFPIVAPMIKICDLGEKSRSIAASQLSKLSSAKGAIVVSRNAFRFLHQLCQREGISFPASLNWYAVGDATAEEMIEGGLNPVLPGEQYDSDGLLNLPALQHVSGETFFLFAGVGGRRKVEDELRQRGAEVVRVELYRRDPIIFDTLNLVSEPDVMTAMSGETVEALAGYLSLHNLNWLNKPLFVPSERAAKVAFNLGFQKVRVTATASKKSLLEALCRYASEV